MSYKAFVSYSHAADGKLASALQSALQNFAKPWYRLRAIRVSRDKTDLAATPELWTSIEQELAESEYFCCSRLPPQRLRPGCSARSAGGSKNGGRWTSYLSCSPTETCVGRIRFRLAANHRSSRQFPRTV